MNSAYYRLALPVVALALLFLFELLRRRLLREKYAVIWMAVAACVTVAGLFPGLVTGLSKLLGITLPANLLLLGGSFVLLLVSVQLSHEVGRLEEESRTLAEEVGLLRLDVQRLQDYVHREAKAKGPVVKRSADQPGSRMVEDDERHEAIG